MKACIGHCLRTEMDVQGRVREVEGLIVAISRQGEQLRVIFWIHEPFPCLCSCSTDAKGLYTRETHTDPWSEPSSWIEGCVEDVSFLISKHFIEEHQRNRKRVDEARAAIYENELSLIDY